MKSHFLYLARYNRWANQTLYRALGALSAEDFRAERGVPFASYCGTLNHILVGDQIWFHRLTGAGAAPDALDAILYAELPALEAARAREDDRIQSAVAGWSEAEIDAEIAYQNLSGRSFHQKRSLLLTHIFNHQTHHRSQAHTLLSQDGLEAPPLDLIEYARR